MSRRPSSLLLVPPKCGGGTSYVGTRGAGAKVRVIDLGFSEGVDYMGKPESLGIHASVNFGEKNRMI